MSRQQPFSTLFPYTTLFRSLSLLLPSLLIMFIPSTFKRPVSSWKALNLRKTLLMASSVRLKPLNCSRLPCVYAQETLTFLLTQKKTCVKNYVQKERSEERFSRNAETDLVCRLLLEKKNNRKSQQVSRTAGVINDSTHIFQLQQLYPCCNLRQGVHV